MPESLDRCQACRARLAEDAICPRCGCDFSLVRQAMAQAARWREQALRSLAVGDRVAARRQIDAALSLHRQRLTEAIGIFLDAAAGVANAPADDFRFSLPELPAAAEPPGGRPDQSCAAVLPV